MIARETRVISNSTGIVTSSSVIVREPLLGLYPTFETSQVTFSPYLPVYDLRSILLILTIASAGVGLIMTVPGTSTNSTLISVSCSSSNAPFWLMKWSAEADQVISSPILPRYSVVSTPLIITLDWGGGGVTESFKLTSVGFGTSNVLTVTAFLAAIPENSLGALTNLNSAPFGIKSFSPCLTTVGFQTIASIS